MEFIGRDSDFCAESKLAAVIESRGGIVHHHGRVHLMLEAVGVQLVRRDDGVRVSGAVSIDVLNGFIKAAHRFD